jgi:beta-glucosidase
MFRKTLLASACLLAANSGQTVARSAPSQTPDQWAQRIESQMTDDERFSLIEGFMPLPFGKTTPKRETWPGDVVPGAGYVPGVPRLGVPSLRETDASLGVTNPFNVRPGDTATALPAGLALGATFNPRLAYAGGNLVGAEARARGFNVLLGGGMNLMRDPRNGRNFEYISEDPLLSGIMAGEAVRGAQAAGVVSTIKHFALNSNETNRHTWNATIDKRALRESDLLAFQIAIERGEPGAIMCAYNLVNGDKSCGNDYLLRTVLKGDWGYRGWVMSDWGAVSDWGFANAGLDQQSGSQLDSQVWFGKPLRQAMADGKFDHARLSDMVRRILRSMKAAGLVEPAPAAKIDMDAHAADAFEIARQGIVLLKNDGVLPIAATARMIAVIGSYAHVGVLSGGGSSQGMPPKGYGATIPIGGGQGEMSALRTERWFASSPVEALKKALPNASIRYDSGQQLKDVALAAADADLTIVFVNKYELEGFDSPDLSLPGNQDAVISAAAAANPNTIVVLETGNPIAMPWKDQVKGIVAAWYPGQEGGRAIADILTGKVNPSGRLPITFPASVEQLPRPTIPSYGTPPRTPVDVAMNEGADVGYRWYIKQARKPLYAFGYGLSFTSFDYSALKVTGGAAVTVRVAVRNTGKVIGADVVQLYLQAVNGAATPRLIAFDRVELTPGESRELTLTVDPRLLADYDERAGRWHIAGGRYSIMLGRAADNPVRVADIRLAARSFGK